MIGAAMLRNVIGAIKDRTSIGDGPHTPTRGVTANNPEPGAKPGDPTGSKWEDEATEERAGRPRRSAKPTTRPSEYSYF